MNKTESKAIAKLALSAYAKHLYEGLTIHENYTLPEVIRYWRGAQEDPAGSCPNYVRTDENIFRLMNDYASNVKRLENAIRRQVTVADVNDWFVRDDREEIAAAKAQVAEPKVLKLGKRMVSIPMDAEGQEEMVRERAADARQKAFDAIQPYDVLQKWGLDRWDNVEKWLDFSTLRTAGEIAEALNIVDGKTQWDGKFRVARRGTQLYPEVR